VDVTCGPGMIFGADPMFADTASGDYRLLPCSPARNAGSNAIVDSLGLLADIAGNPRIQEGTVDMGAFEMPAFSVALDSTANVACHGGNTGLAVIGVVSGCPPFSVSFAGASFFTDSLPIVLDSLPAGTFSIAVNDSEGHTDTVEATITSPPELVATATAQPVGCGASVPGSATAAASGGTPGYTFLWSDGTTGGSTDGLPAGTHALTVTDSSGCTAVDSFTVEATGQLAVATDSTPVSCHPANGNSANGTATATPSGLPPYTWDWVGSQTTETIGMLTPGDYPVTVTDALGCTGTASVTLAAPDSIVIAVNAPSILCSEETGIVAAVASGGTPPYSYLWQSGQADSLLTGAGAGTHTVTLTDANGCTAQATAEIAGNTPVQLDTLIVNATDAANADGSILVSGLSGGTPPYALLWSTGDTAAVVTGLLPGSYALTVTDSVGCATAFVFMVDFGTAAGEALHGLHLRLLPNPVGNRQLALLTVDGDKAEELEVVLYGAMGRKLDSITWLAGQGQLHLTAPDTPGLYWLVVRYGQGQQAVLKWVVQ